MENYYFDKDGAYSGSAAATPGSLSPAHAVRFAPASRTGYWPVLHPSRSEWLLVADYRGQSGYVYGKAKTITCLGPLPEGWSDTPPEELVASPRESRSQQPSEPSAQITYAYDPQRVDFAEKERGDRQFYLTGRGTYHRTASCARADGDWLPFEALMTYPDAKPCGRCRPQGG